jgi:hypothetical protein
VNWHVHPDWKLVELHGDYAVLHHQDGPRVLVTSSARLDRVAGNGLDEYAPEYGRTEKALCLQAAASGAAPFCIRTVIARDGSLEAARHLASSVHP